MAGTWWIVGFCTVRAAATCGTGRVACVCRYGKPLVLDMMEVDMFDAATTRFDSVLSGLMKHIMDKSIMEENV